MGAVLFVREDWLLKASHYKTITVPGHVHKGKWVDPYQKKVLVADNHNDLDVAGGYGSFYQKQAHKKLAIELDHFHTMHPQEKAAIILAHATELQLAASASAAVSQFKASMLAGKVPLPAQYFAMQNAPASVQSKVAEACAAAIGDEKYEQLLFAASAKANQTKGKPDVASPAQAVETKTQGPAQGAAIAEPSKPAAADHSPTVEAAVSDKSITVQPMSGKIGPTTFKPAPDFANYAEAQAWIAARAKALGMSKSDFQSSHEFHYAYPKIKAAYAVVKKEFDDKKADTGAALVAEMNAAGVKLGDTVAWTMTGAFLSSNHYEGKVVLHGGIPHVKLAHEVAVTKPGGKIGYTKFLQWAPYMKVKGAPAVVEPAKVEDAAGSKAPPPPKFADLNHGLVAKQWVKLFESGDHQGLKDSITKLAGNMKANPALGNDPDTLALMKYALELGHTLPGGAPAGPKEGDTKTENGKTYKLMHGHWYRTDAVGVALTPYQLGMLASASGKPNAPVLDNDFMDAYAPAGLVGSSVSVMKMWQAGWAADSANSPVPDGDADNHKAAVAAMETGAFYQKEAIKKLKAEHGDAWAAMRPSKQHELAHAKYQALQGAASQAAAVSGWKKHMLAGQVPTPSEVKAMAAFDTATPDKAVKVMNEVQAVIGLDKYVQLVTQAHAKAAKAPAPAKVFVTTPPPAAAKPASLAGKPAYDHLAQAEDDGGVHKVMLEAKAWLAVNPGKESELNQAVVDMGYSNLAVPVPVAAPVAAPESVNTAKAKFKNNPDVNNFILSFKLHGGKAAQNLSIDDMLDPADIAAFEALSGDDKMAVAEAISFYGPHKLKLFTDWLGAHNAKKAVPAGPVPVTSNVYTNTTDGHKKFWSVSVHGNKMKTTYGKLGTQGSETTKEFSSPAAAVAAANKLKGEKVAKGYTYGYTGVHQYDGAAPAAPAADKVAGVPTQVKDEFDKLAAQGDFKTLQEILDTGGLKPQVKAYLEKLVAANETKPAAFKYNAKDPAFSDAPTLTLNDPEGNILYVAFTDEGKYQVGSIDPSGNLVDHFDYGTPEDAKAQLGVWIGNHPKFTLPSVDEIKKLSDGGPKDGDTKQGVDGTLVFKDGRWHKQGVVIPDFNQLTAGKWGPIYNNLAGALKNAVDTGGLAALKKLVTFHKDGRISVHAASAKLNKLSGVEPHYSGAQKLRREAMFKLVMDLTAAAKALPKGKKVVFTTAATGASVPKPAAAPAAAVSKPSKPSKPAGHKVFVTKDANAASGDGGKKNGLAAPKVVSVQDVISSNVADIGGWTKTGAQEGSNPGGYFTDPDGQQWYCKFPKDPDAAKIELLAIKLYAACGIDVPSMKAVMLNGKPGVASKVITGLKKAKDALASAPGSADGFAVDAWLANWDAVGLGYDNLQIKAGKAIRVDVGGSLDYRAQGAKKGAAFGDTVTELQSMRDASKNAQAAHVFGGLTDVQIGESAKHIFRLKDTAIIKLCNAYGPGSIAEKNALAQKLIARKNDLAAKFPDAYAEFAPKISVVLPMKPNFKEWNGPGKGLSSKAVFNEQNQEIADKIMTMAESGASPDDLSNVQYQPIDESGAPVGGPVPVSSHKSQHIPKFLQDVVASMKNPDAVMPSGLVDAEIDAGGGGLFGSLLSFFDDVKSLASSAYKLGRYAISGKVEGDGLFDSWQYTPKSMKNGMLSAAQHYKDSMANFKKLPQTQQNAISAYTGSAYSTMNNPLTGVGTHGSTDFAIDGIDKAAIPLEEGTVLSRKFSFANDSDENMQKLMQSEGCLLKDFGIISTAMTPGTWSGSVQLHITCAEGVRGLYVAKNPSGGSGAISSHASENEIILPYGTKFFVKKVHKKGHSFTDEHGSWNANLVVEVIALPN